MVYFVCAACGTSLKKNQVTTHWFKCRSDRHVSCMDCGKDFWGEDYSSHIKCITEDEKYGGSNYVSKENKGERKQEEWVMKIKEKVSSTQNMDPQVKELLRRIIQHSNIPRKEAKFRNFMRSSFRVSNTKLVDKVWEIFKDVNSKSDTNGCVNGVKKDASVTGTDNGACNEDVPEAATEAEQDATDIVKLNKRERKELRREEQSKKSKKDKHVERENKPKSGTKRKLDCNGEVVPAVETEEPRKKKKKKQESLEVVVEETVEVKKKKKKKQESVEVEVTVETKKKKKKKDKVSQEGFPQGGEKIKNGTIVTNGNHVLRQEEKNVVEPPQSAVFKWTSAIKRVLAEAPEEGLKLSKLQRKVFSLYYSAYGEAANMKSKEELAGLLSRKLNKKSKFIMHKDRVKLQK